MAEKDLLYYNTDTQQYESPYAKGNDVVQLAQTVSNLTQKTNEKIDEVTEHLAQNTEDLLSRSINVKAPPAPFSPAVGDGVTDDWQTIQDLIEYAITQKKRLFFPPSSYKLSKGLKIRGFLEMVGVFSGTYLDFSGATGDFAIEIDAESLTGYVTITGFNFKSDKSIGGLYLNGDYNDRGIVDSSFKNCVFEGFSTGLRTRNTWCIVFENIRFKTCEIVFNIDEASNNMLFDRCSFSGASAFLGYMRYNEGITFNTCEFSETPGDGILIGDKVNVIFINPYFENITGMALRVGFESSTFAPSTIPSSVKLIGSFFSGSHEIELSSSGNTLDVSGGTSGTVKLKNYAAGPVYWSQNIKINISGNAISSSYNILLDYNGKHSLYTDKLYPASVSTGGAEIVPVDGRVLLSDALEIGKQYILVIGAKRTADTLGFNVDTGSGIQSISSVLSGVDENIKYVYLPFIATNNTIELAFDASILFSKIMLIEGLYAPDIVRTEDFVRMSAPPAGADNRMNGQVIYNTNPTSGGYIGWVHIQNVGWNGFGLIQ